MLNGTKYFNISEEIWIKVPDFTNYYVSNMGRVKRIYKNGKEIILKQYLSHNGYYRVHLWNHGTRKCVRVNRLELQIFTNETGEGLHSHHIDKDIKNNCISNLEWKDSKKHIQEHRKETINNANSR